MVLNRSVFPPPPDGRCQNCRSLPAVEQWQPADGTLIVLDGHILGGKTRTAKSIMVCEECVDRVVLIDGHLIPPGSWARVDYAAHSVGRSTSVVWQWANQEGSPIRSVRFAEKGSLVLYDLGSVKEEDQKRPRNPRGGSNGATG